MEHIRLQRLQKEPTVLMPWFQPSCLHNCGRINCFRCFGPPSCGSLLWQPQETNKDGMGRRQIEWGRRAGWNRGRWESKCGQPCPSHCCICASSYLSTFHTPQALTQRLPLSTVPHLLRTGFPPLRPTPDSQGSGLELLYMFSFLQYGWCFLPLQYLCLWKFFVHNVCLINVTYSLFGVP